ncbi:MAG: transposase [Pseudomonadota bacterium]
MPRLPRLIVPFQPHHVIQRGAGRHSVFVDADDYRVFLTHLRTSAKKFNVAVHAYVLMSNHLHLLATPAEPISLAKMMQWIGRYYVPYFNHKYDRTGTLWQGRYKTAVIDSDQYFLTCSRYIEMNPVRAGLVAKPGNYLWSSYHHHVGERQDAVITEHPLYWALGNTPFAREAAYQQLIDQNLPQDEIEILTASTLKGWAIGSSEFKAALEKKTLQRVQPTKRGRPSKCMTVDPRLSS